MTRTVTALFDNRADAEAAQARLHEASVGAAHVRIHDKSTPGYTDTGYSSRNEPGLWSSIKNAFLPDEDRHTYEEGVRRGGFLLTADVDEDNVDHVVRVLEEADTVDIDECSQQWRSSGWEYQSGGYDDTGGYATGGGQGLLGGGIGAGTTGTGLTGTGQSEAIPIVEEELVVGKREVDRGGVRVRSYVTETPVHEQIRLRNERIDVERRPVDRAVAPGDDAFRERTIDVSATGEEAVVGKTARVVEEVVVSKTADDHVESIDDSVRRTDVEIDRDGVVDGAAPRRDDHR